MKARMIYTLLGAALCISMLAGCVQTPEDSLIKQKGTASLGNYEEGSALKEADEQENALRQTLNAPEQYENTLTDATGKLTIHTNARVEIPNAQKVSAIHVTQHPFDQDQIDQITNAFFADGTIYDLEVMNQMTKADCMEKIQELKGYVAEGNLDPYDAGKDENGNYVWDIYQAIEEWEKNYEDAPEETELVEVTPSMEDRTRDKGGKQYTDSNFYGYVVMPDGAEYTYILKAYDSMPMDVEIRKTHIDASTGEKDYQSGYPWTEYHMVAGSDHTNWKNFPDEDQLKNNLEITYENALKLAEEKVQALGFTDMVLGAWDYGVYGVDHADIRDDYSDMEVQDYGYIFHFVREVNGIPITYTMDSGGSLESMDSDMETWCYEQLEIVVTKDGIDLVDFFNRYDMGEVKTEHLNLLSFDEIMEVYEKMILITNADMADQVEKETIDIERITFGYTRIYEPATSSIDGVLVPVWDFFGKRTTEYIETDGNLYTSSSDMDNYSLITINALDGSIIDRGLGY